MQPATVPRTANEIRPQTCKALLGAVEIISLDTKSLQRACTPILTRSKPLRKMLMPQNVRQMRSLLGVQPLKHGHSASCYEKESNSSSHPTTSASSEKLDGLSSPCLGLPRFRSRYFGIKKIQARHECKRRRTRRGTRTATTRQWCISELECAAIVQAIRRNQKKCST